MIRVVRGDLCLSQTEAIVREVSADGTSRTSVGRRAEVRMGDTVRGMVERMGEMPIGTAILTPAGELTSAYILHIFVSSFEEPITLRSVEKGLRNGLRRAADFGIESLALPPVGFSAGNLDAEGTATALVDVLQAHLIGGEPPLRFEVVVESDFEEDVFMRAMARGD